MTKIEFESFLDCNYYEKYAFVQKFSAQKLSNEVRSYEKNILEIGFGTGFLTRLLHKNRNIKSIDAVEISEKMFLFAKDKMQNIPLHLKSKTWITDYAFPKNYYDLIISNFTFQWFQNLENILNIFKKHGKRVLFSIPIRESFVNCDFTLINTIPSKTDLELILRNLNAKFEIVEYLETYENQIAFLRHLKLIGATVKSSSLNEFPKIIRCSDSFQIKYIVYLISLDN